MPKKEHSLLNPTVLWSYMLQILDIWRKYGWQEIVCGTHS